MGLARELRDRFRLRHKFVLTLLVAALLPVAVATSVAVQLLLANLEGGVKAQAERTRDVALNLVVREVQAVFESAAKIAEDPRLAAALEAGPDEVRRFVDDRDEQLPPGLMHIVDEHGLVVTRHRAGRRLDDADFDDRAEPIRRALGYERRVSIECMGRCGDPAHGSAPPADGKARDAGPPMLLVRAAMPVVDAQYRLRGALVLSVPLDTNFADLLKAELSADVVLYADSEPVASSFVADDGRPLAGFRAPPEALAAVEKMQRAVGEVRLGREEYAAGFAPLLDQDGRRVGMIAVATGEEHVRKAQTEAWRSLAVGGALAFGLALVLAAMLSRTLTRPLARLHEAARAVARGDLEAEIRRETGDEIGDLADALKAMTRAVRDNQGRLAARMREIVTLHEIGRAVSSVLTLDDVLRRIVDQLTAVLAADKTALLFAPDGGLRVGASVRIEDGFPLRQFCQLLYWWDGPLLLPDIAAVPELAEAAADAGMRGSLLAVPLEQKDDILGLLLVNREHVPFGDNDLRLVATFADHAATAIQNGRLYDAVQRSSEDLERKVVERTAELTAANRELARLLDELGQAQAQLVLSERMAGLGFLVAGIAHEVNSPAGAIQGAIDAMGDNVDRLVTRSRALGQLTMTPEDRQAFFDYLAAVTPKLAQARVEAPAQVRRRARELKERLVAEGFQNCDAPCRTLAEIGAATDEDPLAGPLLGPLLGLARRYGLEPLVGYLEQHAYLHRNIHAIRTAIARIRRIVGALKGYSHLDQAKVAPADIHEGIENTLIILHHELSRGIVVNRDFAELPPVPVYVDELNQVWTNLIQNAAQALGGTGEITVRSRLDGDAVEVSVIDNGPGIPPEIVNRIFEAFFTTKKPGQGTGLGLGIARQIVEKHGGRIEVESQPGRTRFSVRLPLAGPPRPAQSPESSSEVQVGAA